MSESQKAYSSEKILPEAILNILENIDLAKKLKKTLALISIDFKKAFDSISHEYIEEVMKFFNFSEYMVQIF